MVHDTMLELQTQTQYLTSQVILIAQKGTHIRESATSLVNSLHLGLTNTIHKPDFHPFLAHTGRQSPHRVPRTLYVYQLSAG